MIRSGRSGYLTPSATDVAAILIAVYWFWFLADTPLRAAVAATGIVLALSLSRLTRWLRASLHVGHRIVWSLLLVALFMIVPLLVGYQLRSAEFAWLSLIVLAVLGVNLLALTVDRVRFGVSGFLATGVVAAAAVQRISPDDVALTIAGSAIVAVVVAMLLAVIGLALRLKGQVLVTAAFGLCAPLMAWTPQVGEIRDGHTGNLLQLGGSAFNAHLFSAVQLWLFVGTVFLTAILVVLLARRISSGESGAAFAHAVLGGDSRPRLPAGVGYVFCAANAGFGGALFFILEPRFLEPTSLVMLLAIDVVISTIALGRGSVLGALLVGLATVFLYGEGAAVVVQDSPSAGDFAAVVSVIVIAAGLVTLFGRRGGLAALPTRILSRLRVGQVRGQATI